MLSILKSHSPAKKNGPELSTIPAHLLRENAPNWPCLSELETVRHFTHLSQTNFSIDTQSYPLGSCTMKYNPKAAHTLASLPGFLNQHPLTQPERCQGFLKCLYELQNILIEVTGMQGVSLSPMAGAQGEFAGVSMIKAYHANRQDSIRDEFLVPDSAHGTNPASAAMCGYKVVEIKTTLSGDIDLEDLEKHLSPRVAGMMLTNPSTLGVFERNIKTIANKVHAAGGLLYYDGANLNAILGMARPGDMGFDVMHMNLHKTFATPHGGGGPGAGPVAANDKLKAYLPIPIVREESGFYRFETRADRPQTIGRLSAFHGNAGILLRAYIYAKLLGKEGLKRVALYATLNANYLLKRCEAIGFHAAYPKRLATHEFVLTLQEEKKQYDISALEVSKALLDYGIHAPTMYFPLLVPECLLIEPTETESKRELDLFIQALTEIRAQFSSNPSLIKSSPHHCTVKRVDDVLAARLINCSWRKADE